MPEIQTLGGGFDANDFTNLLDGTVKDGLYIASAITGNTYNTGQNNSTYKPAVVTNNTATNQMLYVLVFVVLFALGLAIYLVSNKSKKTA